MMRFFARLILIAGFLPLCGRAQVTFSNTVPYTNLTGGAYAAPVTNQASVPINIGSAAITPPVYSLSHGTITNLTDVTNYIQIAIGGPSNWVTLTSFSPSNTNNASVDSLTLSRQYLPVYTRVLISTTNAGGAGVGAQVVQGTSSIPQ
jgi:hypothetical protein